MGIYILNKAPKIEVEKTDEAQVTHHHDANVIEKEADKKGDGKTIVIEGPLSHVYTQALNMAYSKEDFVMTMNGSDTVTSDDEEYMDVKGDVYLYCCDSKDLDKGGLTEVTDKLRVALSSNKGKKVIVAVECGDSVGNKIGLLDEYSTSIGVEMVVVRQKSMDRLQKLLEV